MRDPRRAQLALLCAVAAIAAALLMVSSAYAANLSAAGGSTLSYTGTGTGASAEANTLTVTRDADSVNFADATGIVIAVAGGCTNTGSDNTAECPLAAGTPVNLTVDAGEGGDSV